VSKSGTGTTVKDGLWAEWDESGKPDPVPLRELQRDLYGLYCRLHESGCNDTLRLARVLRGWIETGVPRLLELACNDLELEEQASSTGVVDAEGSDVVDSDDED